ncbi:MULTISPECIES: phosphatase PAP2 family protein [Pseudomonadota]|uniref:phosphatase PAP2 family protein n=1 Tax=Pseudomonadota TaxID=1224 RepID=UPI000555F703|nr:MULTISPECIES: phosphatase PAP2 family protein [Pseudomonadota]MEB1083489.1 phosphatase PAP2 family protein [Citrobacter portucalensis]PHZ02303.1 undecaprenyl-diphosphatase [Citrobacter freundii]
MNEIETLSRTWFLQINGSNDTPTWLVHIAVGIADDLIYLIPLLLLGFWLWGSPTRRSMALKASLVTLVSLAANQAICALWPHPRPFMIGLGHAWMVHVADSSFPSDHMTVFCGIGLTLFFEGAVAWGIVTLLVGLGVAWARVFLGVHFPLDMVGALVVSLGVYAALTPFWSRVGLRITGLVEQLYRTILAQAIRAGWVRG